jgi:hypothetical protein
MAEVAAIMGLEAEMKRLEEKTKTLEAALKFLDEVQQINSLATLSVALSEAKRQKLRLEEELRELETILTHTKRNLKVVATCEDSSPKERRMAILALKQADPERIEQRRLAGITLEAKARQRRLRWGS